MPSGSTLLQDALRQHQAGDLATAEAAYRRIVDSDPHNADALHLLGVLTHQRGLHDDGARLIEQAIGINDAVPAYHCNLGATHQSMGRLDEAEVAFQRTLKLQPDFPDAIFNLGLIEESRGQQQTAISCFERTIRIDQNHLPSHLHRAKIFHLLGRTKEAASGYQRVLQLDPNHAVARTSLANIVFREGRLAEAAQILQEVIAQQPESAFAQLSLGRVLQAQGEFQQAADCFQKAIATQPDLVDAHAGLGTTRSQLGQYAQAALAYQKAVELNPDSAPLQHDLGLALWNDGRPAEAVEHFRQTIQIDPAHAQAHNNLGLALKDLGRRDEALQCLLRAGELLPNSADVACNLGDILTELGRCDEAINHCRRALTIDPSHIGALNNLANALIHVEQIEAAIEQLHKALAIAPQCAEVHNSLGVAHLALEQHQPADSAFSAAIQADPQHIEAHYNRAMTRLLVGDYEHGWSEFQWRWQRKGVTEPSLPIPAWDGCSLGGKTLFVYGEQGIGDEIMYASCLPELIDQTEQCVLACEPRLVPLFARSFPQATVVSAAALRNPTHTVPLPQMDFAVALATVPQYLRRSSADFPRQTRYLIADPQRVDSFRERLQQLDGKRKIGISWRGGADPVQALRRSTTLQQWLPVLLTEDVTFINLQYGNCAHELEELREQHGLTIHDFSDVDPLQNLDCFAALIAALDQTVSIDNSTAHLAAALGKPAWVALPTAAEWRWGIGSTTCDWYKTIRLFRQTQRGQWETVLQSMADELTPAPHSGQ